MPRMSPGQPEAVTYDEYEELRDDGLSVVSLHPKQLYTVRLRAAHQVATREVYAYDVLSLVETVKLLGKYSIINARIKDVGGWGSIEAGLNQHGLLFNHSPMPEDVDELPYKAEVGYFVGRADGSRGRTIEDSEAQRVHSPEELLLVAH